MHICIYIYIYIYRRIFDIYIYQIHKRLQNVPERPVISNSGYYTENISASLEFHLKPLAQKVKSYIKDTNDFLRKIASLPLCQMTLLYAP